MGLVLGVCLAVTHKEITLGGLYPPILLASLVCLVWSVFIYCPIVM